MLRRYRGHGLRKVGPVTRASVVLLLGSWLRPHGSGGVTPSGGHAAGNPHPLWEAADRALEGGHTTALEPPDAGLPGAAGGGPRHRSPAVLARTRRRLQGGLGQRGRRGAAWSCPYGTFGTTNDADLRYPLIHAVLRSLLVHRRRRPYNRAL